MEDVIKALLEEGVSVDQFVRFASDYGIQEDPNIQGALHRLILRDTSPASPRMWSSAEADDLLELLKSPQKPQHRSPLKEIQTNVQNDTGPRGFACNQCPKIFTQKRNLLQHVKSTHQKLSYACPKCHKTFSRQSNLRQHESICKGIDAFSCDQFHAISKTAMELEFHQKTEHSIQKKKSGKAAKAASPAKPHRPNTGSSSHFRKEIQTNVQHANGPRGFACHLCPKNLKTFTQKRSLERHIKSAHQKNTYSCSNCHKTFSRHSNLRQHETNCEGIVTFPCDQCQDILKTARELEFHQKIKHKIQKKRAGKVASAVPPVKRRSPKPGVSSYDCRQCRPVYCYGFAVVSTDFIVKIRSTDRY